VVLEPAKERGRVRRRIKAVLAPSPARVVAVMLGTSMLGTPTLATLVTGAKRELLGQLVRPGRPTTTPSRF
jgi:hypothetical protein